MPAPATGGLLGQGVRFGVVGLANTLVTYLVTRGLHDGLGVAVGIAGFLGYAVAVVQSFLLNRGWTFAATRSERPVTVEAAGFVAVNAVCALVFGGLVGVAEPRLGLALATIAGVAVTMPLGFALNRWLVFR